MPPVASLHAATGGLNGQAQRRAEPRAQRSRSTGGVRDRRSPAELPWNRRWRPRVRSDGPAKRRIRVRPNRVAVQAQAEGRRPCRAPGRVAALSVAVLAILSLACACARASSAPGASPAPPIAALPCPAHPPRQPASPVRPGGSSRLVPAHPVVLTAGGKTQSRVLRGVEPLVAQLNGLRHVHKPINFMCPNRPGGAFLLRFRYTSGPRWDVLVQGSN